MKSLESSSDRKSFWNLESPITYDETLSPVSSISTTVGPSKNTLADYESLRDFSVEDDTPIIK